MLGVFQVHLAIRTGMVIKEVIIFTWLAGLVSGNGAHQQFRGVPIAGAGARVVGPFAGGSYDFNPILLQGVRGYPGIRARINQRTFQYASGLIAEVLNQQIKKARIPPITQCIPQVQGCAQIYNLYVSRYRCPQRVVLYPAPQNRIILQVDNVDIGVTGNLGGRVVVLLPIPLSGIIQLNIQQVGITVELSLERGPSGPYMQILSCNVQIGYADAYIENGGLIGYIINTQFRQRISSQVKEMIPSRICGQLPTIVSQMLNTRLAALPQLIAVTQLLSMFGNVLPFGGLGQTPSPQFCQAQCRGAAPPGSPQLPASSLSTAAHPAPRSITAGLAPQIPQMAYGGRRVAHGTQQKSYSTNQLIVPAGRTKRDAPRAYRITNLATSPYKAAAAFRTSRGGAFPQGPHIQYQGRYPPTMAVRFPPGSGPMGPPPAVPGAPLPQFVSPPSALCARCPGNGGADDPMAFLRQLAAGLDLRKLSNLYLSVQILSTQATSNDFIVNLSGEFSENGQGGTPFGAFPVSFPSAYDSHMVELVVSDYTINTLFYQLHRKQFLTFQIGPDTPKIGELLKTTCSEDEDEELEGTEVELDEDEESRRLKNALRKLKKLRTRRSTKERGKRQDDAGGLADLGICFGDILPAVREKYPNQRIAIVIRTARAPSVILSQAQGGTVILDLVADADLYIYGTNNRVDSICMSFEKLQHYGNDLDFASLLQWTIPHFQPLQVGTITIATTVVIVAQLRGNRLYGTAMITNLKLTDRAGTLGLPQDALDNLGNLGKELVQKMLNDTLQKGVQINIPTGSMAGLPINIINPSFRIIEHGLYIATDITISPSLFGISGREQC